MQQKELIQKTLDAEDPWLSTQSIGYRPYLLIDAFRDRAGIKKPEFDKVVGLKPDTLNKWRKLGHIQPSDLDLVLGCVILALSDQDRARLQKAYQDRYPHYNTTALSEKMFAPPASDHRLTQLYLNNYEGDKRGGIVLQALREHHGKKREEVAKALGVTLEKVAAMEERGDRDITVYLSPFTKILGLSSAEIAQLTNAIYRRPIDSPQGEWAAGR